MQCLNLRTGRVTCSGSVLRKTRTAQHVSLVAMAPRVRSTVRVMAAGFSPTTVSETKKKFLSVYTRPIPSIYNTVVQELLVQMHFIRYSINYEYNEIYALGFVSVFDQIMEALPAVDRGLIFDAYLTALEEDPAKFRKDAEALEQEAQNLSGPDGLAPDASGSTLQQVLARVSDKASTGKFGYNKFFAIGLFRLLELTGAKEPAALERLVKSVGVKPEAVNRDLLLYKGILSKMNAARELMKEFIEREKRKAAEREEEKKARAEKEKAESNSTSAPVQA